MTSVCFLPLKVGVGVEDRVGIIDLNPFTSTVIWIGSIDTVTLSDWKKKQTEK